MISTEVFAHGMYGGFGTATRSIAKGLLGRGVEVYVVTNRRPGQPPVEVLDGVTVVSYPGSPYLKLSRSRPFAAIYKWIDADIYHSQEPSIGTVLAQIGAPHKKHVVTLRDPRRLDEHKAEWIEAGRKGLGLMRLEWRYRASYALITRAVKRAHARYAAAEVVIPRAIELYGLKDKPEFLPTPIEMPRRKMNKAATPTVCFLARWDPRKRPEIFFELARRFPDVRFVAMGACQPHFQERDRRLREEYGSIPNLEMPGVLFGEDKSRILEESWVLVNTAWREGLPLSFVEASSHECAILSGVDPDNFAGRYGYLAEGGDLDAFDAGLRYLLEHDRWRELGQRGCQYVRQVFEFDRAIDRHLENYEKLLTE